VGIKLKSTGSIRINIKKIFENYGTMLLLVIADQIIKLFIYYNHMDKNVDIIKNILAFYPMFNKDYSWINSLFQFGIGLVPHIIVVCLLLFCLLLFYDFLITKKKGDKIIKTAFSFVIAAAFCSLIDKVLWGGSLDYVYLKGFFVFDLKDVYVSVFEVLTVITVIKRIKKLDERKLLKDFFGFIKDKYSRKT